MPADRISKICPPRIVLSPASAASLLRGLIGRLSEMPDCSHCSSFNKNCQPSDLDSSRCTECVRSHRSGCDLLGPSHSQFLKVAEHHEKVEAELEFAENDLEEAQKEVLAAQLRAADKIARVRILRKQKRIWAERVVRMVRRGLASLEALDEIEAKEALGQVVSVATVEPAPDFTAESVLAAPFLFSEDFDFSSLPPLDLFLLGTPGVFFLTMLQVLDWFPESVRLDVRFRLRFRLVR